MNHDPLDTCPYDPAHRILRSRMPYHLPRCFKNHPNAKKLTCPYDARHVVDEVAYKYHVDTCSKGESVWHSYISDQPNDEPITTLPIEPFNAQCTESWEENWDEDGHVRSYNPLQNIQDRPVTHMVAGLSKFEKKIHRLNERQRFAKIENERERSEKAKQEAYSNAKNKKVGSGTERKKTSQTNTNDQGEQEYKPLRRPRKQTQDMLNASRASVIDTTRASVIDTSRASVIDTSIASVHQEPSEKPNTSAAIPQQSNHDNSDSALPPEDFSTRPFSYSAALNGKSKNKTQEGEKENIANNNSLHNNTADSSVIEKLSSTLNEIAVCDEGHKIKSEKLNKEIDMAKKINLSKNSASNAISSNKFKKLPRCAANFSRK